MLKTTNYNLKNKIWNYLRKENMKNFKYTSRDELVEL